MTRLFVLLVVGALVACDNPTTSATTPLTAIQQLDSLRRQFGAVTIENEYLGDYVKVMLPDGRRSDPVHDLPLAITTLFHRVHP